MRNETPQYGTYPHAVWTVPPWADPQKIEQDEMRKAASRLSWAVAVSMPLSSLITAAVDLLSRLFGDTGISGMPMGAYYLLSALMTFITIVLPFALFLIFGKRSLSESILVQKTGFLHGSLLVFAGLFFCIIMNIPANILSELLESAGLNGAANTESMRVNSTWDVIALCFSVVLVAPLAEEFAFRGVTVAVMRRWGDWPAVLFSAILFAFAHYSFQALPVVLTGGLVMALLYVWTRNIWVTIFIHLLNNIIATVPIVVEFYVGEQASLATSNLLMMFVCTLGIFAIIMLAIRHFTGMHELSFAMQKGVRVRKKAGCLFLNVGFIVYFIAFIVIAVVTLYAV